MTLTALAGASGGLRVAIIGCGAVAEQIHLPALKRAGIQASVLVDVDRNRAEILARLFDVGHIIEDHREASTYANAAIVATPHASHCELSCDLLEQGLDVLVEKPMASSSAECDQMIRAARTAGRILEIGLMRRNLVVTQWIADIISSGLIVPRTFHLAEGYKFSWPVVSPAFFSPSNGGVLLDTGAHALDLVATLFPDLTVEAYYDDCYGGVEADCRIELRGPGNISGVVELSRTRNMRNTLILETAPGTIEMQIYGKDLVLSPELGRLGANGRFIRKMCRQSIEDLFDLQLRGWMGAIQERAIPLVGAEAARRSVVLMEECTSARQHLALPWDVAPGVAA